MWLFLATEVLFFGALFLTWIYSRYWNQAGFDAGARQTDLAIGTINTVILLASSFVFSAGLAFIEAGNTRRLIQCCDRLAARDRLSDPQIWDRMARRFQQTPVPGAGLRYQRPAWRRSTHILRTYDRRPSAGRVDHPARVAG